MVSILSYENASPRNDVQRSSHSNNMQQQTALDTANMQNTISISSTTSTQNAALKSIVIGGIFVKHVVVSILSYENQKTRMAADSESWPSSK